MNVEELSNQFDVKLGVQIKSDIEFEINEYEKSIFLTDAQEFIYNKLYPRYDKDEYAKRALGPSVMNLVVLGDTFIIKDKTIALNDFKSYYLSIPSDLLYITNEQLEGIEGNSIDVKPIKIDFYNTLKKNPFKKPNDNKCWRTEFSSENVTSPSDNNKDSHLEIITSLDKSKINKYICTYLRYPTPIILEDLGDLTIRGYSDVTEAILNNITHDDIVTKAVELAIRSLNISNQE